jgi:amino acid adenylation domain-containing protein/non-ribosomal peptide synthase protein (TIGR01720 family)
VLIREVAALYQAYSAGEPSPLQELAIQYADFAAWQRQWLTGDTLNSQLSYWKQHLQEAPALLELPMERARAPVRNSGGAHHAIQVSAEVSETLKELSKREGATLFMVLLAAFGVLLRRYSAQDDIVIGTPIANRNRIETENLIGFFVNQVGLRMDVAGDQTFKQLVQRVKETALRAYANQDLPFEQLIDELRLERDLSYTPLFQVMFAMQNVPIGRLSLAGLTLSPVEVEAETAKFDLSLTMAETKSGLMGSLQYSTGLFGAASMERMAQHFQTLLESVAADLDQPIWALPILSENERHQLLVHSNDTKKENESETIQQLFEAQAAATPESIAVVASEEQVTYAELNKRANQLAHHLRLLGVGPEVLVGICVERSIEMVVGLLGILKAGGAYLPLDGEYPLERLSFMLEDAGVTVLLTQERSLSVFPEHSAKVVCMDRDWAVIGEQSVENPECLTTAENLCYVIYTSGSTGRPKGVEIEHRGLVNYVNWSRETYPFGAKGRTPVHSSLSFDLTVTSLYGALVSGGCLELIGEQRFGLSRALGEGAEFNVVKLTPGQLQLLNLEVKKGAAGRVAALVLGGENLLSETVKSWLELNPETRVFNEYGPTETVVGCCIYEFKEMADSAASVPIGRAIANTQLYILDDHRQPVPLGVAGELYIGGEGVARGYLKQPQLTAEKFVPHPFSGEEGARLYRTGDLTRFRQDGQIEYLGRLDQQVKVRGYRIELGEIETELRQHDLVQECVVIAKEDELGHQRLIAYVVSEGTASPASQELQVYLKQRLPDYMLPAAFVMLDEIPLSANGKVDRAALPEPKLISSSGKDEFYAPQTPVEVALANIWSVLLGVEHVSVRDKFFDLGGDSILVIQVVARARQVGISLTPKLLFQYQTISELAAVAQTVSQVTAEQGTVTGEAPLTPIQHDFFARALPDKQHYNQSIMLEAQQEVDASLLKRAVDHLLLWHDSLRARFVRELNGWRQFVAATEEGQLFLHRDFSGLSEAERSHELEMEVAKQQESLDFTEGPLVRVALFEMGSGKPQRLLIVIHHLVVDGVSWRILLEDLQTTYSQLSQGEEIQLAPKTTSFNAWSNKLSEHARSATLAQEAEYWLAIPHTTPAGLPIDFDTAANTIESTRSVSVSLTESETQALLLDVPDVYHTKINDVLLTALAQAFSVWTRRQFILVDVEGHGREELDLQVDLSRTVGWFTTLFPVCLDLQEALTPGDALINIKEQLRKLPNNGIGYGLLRFVSDDKEVAQRLAALPQAEVIFNYLGQFDQVLAPSDSVFKAAGESSGSNSSKLGWRRHLLEIDGMIAGGRLRVNWKYSENIHRRKNVEALAESYIAALRKLISHCASAGAGGFTPSDFPDAALSKKSLDRLMSKVQRAGLTKV